MTLPSAFADLIIPAFGVCLLGCFVCWFVGLYHLLMALRHVRPVRPWGRDTPLADYLPLMLTAPGKVHRTRLLRAAGGFIVFGALALALDNGVFTGAV